jgi:hypothetical protein
LPKNLALNRLCGFSAIGAEIFVDFNRAFYFAVEKAILLDFCQGWF